MREPVGEFVDRLLHGERAGRIARAAHRRSRGPALMNTSCCAAVEIRAGVERLGEIADAGADPDAGGAVACSEIAVSVPSRRAPIRRCCQVAGPIAGVDLLFLAVEHHAHRRARLTRQHHGDAAVIAERATSSRSRRPSPSTFTRTWLSFRPKSPPVRWRTPAVNCVDIYTVSPSGAPVGDDRVRLQAAMGLHLRAIFALDHDLGLRRSPARRRRGCLVAGPRTLPLSGRSGRRRISATAGPAVPTPRRERPRRIRLRAPHPDRRRTAAARNRRGSGAAPPRPPPRTSPRPPRPARRHSARHGRRRLVRPRDDARPRARRDGARPPMRRSPALAHAACGERRMRAVQHAGQLDIDGEARRAGDLGAAVLARHRLADHRELGVRRQRRRFVGRDLRVRSRRVRRRRCRPEMSRACRRRVIGSMVCASSRPGSRERRGDDVRIGAAAADMAADRCLDILRASAAACAPAAPRSSSPCPGVQKPHCIASCSMKASCTGCSTSPCARPSIVVTARSPTSIASIMQEQTGAPSSQTVQAEQAPRLQRDLGAGEIQRAAQHLGERHVRLDAKRTRCAVNPERNRDGPRSSDGSFIDRCALHEL